MRTNSECSAQQKGGCRRLELRREVQPGPRALDVFSPKAATDVKNKTQENTQEAFLIFSYPNSYTMVNSGSKH